MYVCMHVCMHPPKTFPTIRDYKPSLAWNTLQAYREREGGGERERERDIYI